MSQLTAIPCKMGRGVVHDSATGKFLAYAPDPRDPEGFKLFCAVGDTIADAERELAKTERNPGPYIPREPWSLV